MTFDPRFAGRLRGPTRRRWLLASGILVLFLADRVGLVAGQSLWTDELFSLAIATGHSVEHAPDRADPALGDYVETPGPQPPSAYARYLEHEVPPAGPRRIVRAVLLSDTNPPLYYLLLSAWTRVLGTSDVSVRGFSLICGLACLPLLWSLGQSLGGTRATALACLLFAVEPFSVYYSTEARMYPLLWLFVTAFLALSYRLRARGVRAGLMVGWVVAGAGCLLVHYFAMPVWAAVLSWLMMWPGRFSRRWQWAGIAATLLLILPWYIHLPESFAGWRVTADWLKMRPPRFRFWVDLLRLPWRPFTTHGLWGGSLLVELLAAAGFAATLVLALLRRGKEWLGLRYQPLWLSVLATCGALVALDGLRGTYTMSVPRYTAAALPPAYLMAGLMLGRIGWRYRSVLVGLLLVTAAAALVGMQRNPSRVGQPYGQLGRILAGGMKRGDVLIIHSIPIGACGVARAMVAAGAEDVGLIPWTPVLGLRRIPDDLERLTKGRGRVFFVRIHTVGMEPVQAAELRRRRPIARSWKLEASEVLEFGPEHAPVVEVSRASRRVPPGPGGSSGPRGTTDSSPAPRRRS